MTVFYCDHDFYFSLLLEVLIVGWELNELSSGRIKCSLSAVGDIKNIGKRTVSKINWVKGGMKRNGRQHDRRGWRCASLRWCKS